MCYNKPQEGRNGKLVEKQGRKTEDLRCMHYGSRVTEAFCGDFVAFFTKAIFFFQNSKV